MESKGNVHAARVDQPIVVVGCLGYGRNLVHPTGQVTALNDPFSHRYAEDG